MIITIDNHNGIPVYRQIVSQISEMILTGQLKPGEQLMSVRELAATIKANPMTVSKAYAILEREGLLERRRGIGLFVRNSSSSMNEQDMRHEITNAVVGKAVKTAIRLGFSEEQVLEKFKEFWAKYGDRKDE